MQTWWLCKQCSIHILNDEILSFGTKTTKTGKAPELKRGHCLIDWGCLIQTDFLNWIFLWLVRTVSILSINWPTLICMYPFANVWCDIYNLLKVSGFQNVLLIFQKTTEKFDKFPPKNLKSVQIIKITAPYSVFNTLNSPYNHRIIRKCLYFVDLTTF